MDYFFEELTRIHDRYKRLRSKYPKDYILLKSISSSEREEVNNFIERYKKLENEE